MLLATRRTRNVRSESGDLWNTKSVGDTVKEQEGDGPVPVTGRREVGGKAEGEKERRELRRRSRNESFVAVVRAKGREREMCSGSGALSSDVRKLWSLWSLSGGPRRS